MTAFTVGSVFTEQELLLAQQIVEDESCCKTRVERLEREIVDPAIGRINKQTGQQNLPRYFAYLLEYVMTLPRN